jgi:glycosyltransferase involved in cell wall biosynthesis
VVVPIHNSEGRTAKLRESIQKAKNIEFVLVFDSCDDGTVGEFVAILENCVKLNVQAIYGEFGSPGFARNAGLKLVNTKWVVFWDADDFPDPFALVKCTSTLYKDNFDMIVTQYSKVAYLSQEKLGKASHTRHKYQLVVNPGIWRVVFNAHFVKQVWFPRFRMGEDQCFLAEILSKNPNIFFSPQITYAYTVGSPGQLTRDPQAKLELKGAIRFTFEQALKTKHNRLALGLMAGRQTASFLKMHIFG